MPMVKYHLKFNKSTMCLYGRLANARGSKPAKKSINLAKYMIQFPFVKFDCHAIVHRGRLPSARTKLSNN